MHEPQHNPSLFVHELIILCVHVPLEEQISVVQGSLSEVQAVPVNALCAQVPLEEQTSLVHGLPSLEQAVPVNAL